MVLLILESLGSTELLFILVMALVFFGPRKLPQLSRSLGKNLAEFRKASEDFKRTWEKEVNLEESELVRPSSGLATLPAENSILDPANQAGSLQPPTVEAVAPDQVIARHTPDQFHTFEPNTATTDQSDLGSTSEEPKPSAKHDWL